MHHATYNSGDGEWEMEGRVAELEQCKAQCKAKKLSSTVSARAVPGEGKKEREMGKINVP